MISGEPLTGRDDELAFIRRAVGAGGRHTGVAIVGHGRSSVKAVRNAVAMAYRFATDRFIERIDQEIAAASACGSQP